MIILGINGGPNSINRQYIDTLNSGMFHDSSAVLIRDGIIEIGIEEERLTRIKHTNLFPTNAILKCLNKGNIRIEEVDYFAFGIEESWLHKILSKEDQRNQIPEANLSTKFIHQILSDHIKLEVKPEKIKFYSHHYSHATGAFYQSGFNDSLVLTLDGAGDGISGSIFSAVKGKLFLLDTISIENSLGYYYLEVIRFLGFQLFDEYKVMGLAPYGIHKKYASLFESFYELLPEGKFIINKSQIHKLNTLCKPRRKTDKIESIHKDIAASLQKSLEIIVCHIVSYYKEVTEHKNLCLSGGVALNCSLTGEILYKNWFDDIFVQPAASDSGLAVGAALACYHEYNTIQKYKQVKHVYLGSDSDKNENVEIILKKWSGFLKWNIHENHCREAAKLLANNKVLGWFQNSSEFGPRALGNRSIIADPRSPEMKSRINSIIKMREGFRPFAPSVLEEKAQDVFEIPNNKTNFSYMTFVLKVKEKYKKILGATTHIDSTARLQTVSKDVNPNYWNLINEFYLQTKIPVVLNTSFNNNWEPIVDNVEDAICCFLTSDIDHLVINNYIISKEENWEEKLMDCEIKTPGHVKLKRIDNQHLLYNAYNKKRVNISNEFYQRVFLGSAYSKSTFYINFLHEVKKLWSYRLIIVKPKEIKSSVSHV